MQRLNLLRLVDYPSVLPPGTDRRALHATLAKLLARGTGPETAGLFAVPSIDGDAVVFQAPDGELARFAELDAEGQAALRAEIGRLISELRRTAERDARAGPAAAGLPALVAAAIEVPSFETVWALEGRPVLAGWGSLPAGQASQRLLARLDDGKPAPLPARAVPWPALCLAAALLALLAGGAAGAWPWMARALSLPAPSCQADPAGLQAMRDLADQQARESELRNRLAGLLNQLGQNRQSCPIPVALPAPSPTPAPRAQEALPAPREPPSPPEPPRPPPNATPCNSETKSGRNGVTTTRHFLGPTPGHVVITYDMKLLPDHMRVFHQGRLVTETPGPVSFRGMLGFDYAPPPGGGPETQVIEVVIIGGGGTTEWQYALRCPQPNH